VDEGNLAANLEACARAGVVLVEQPLPEAQDEALRHLRRAIPVCADESAHDRASLAALVGKYDAVNIKLDKAGGLTEALAMLAEAERLGFTIMGRVDGGDFACRWRRRCCWRSGRALSISTARCCWPRTATAACATDGSLAYPPEPVLWG